MIYIHMIGDIVNEPRTRNFQQFLNSTGESCTVVRYQLNQIGKFKKYIYFILYILYLNKARQVIKIFDLKIISKFSRNDTQKQWDNSTHFITDLQIVPFLLNRELNNAKFILDLNEYYPYQKNNFKFLISYKYIYRYILNKYVGRMHKVITVSESHRNIISRNHNIDSTVILSLPSKRIAKFKIDTYEMINCIYFGLANKYRGLEFICDTFKSMSDRFVLNIFLNGDHRYITQLIHNYLPYNNINIKELSSNTDLKNILSNSHIGLALYNKPWNAKFALPNKFFKFIQMHLMVIVMDKSEMGKLVKNYSNGIVIKSWSIKELESSLKNLKTFDLNNYRYRSYIASKELYFQKYYPKLKEIFFKW